MRFFSAGFSDGPGKGPKFGTNANPSQTIQFDSGPVDHGNELVKNRSAVRPQTTFAYIDKAVGPATASVMTGKWSWRKDFLCWTGPFGGLRCMPYKTQAKGQGANTGNV